MTSEQITSTLWQLNLKEGKYAKFNQTITIGQKERTLFTKSICFIHSYFPCKHFNLNRDNRKQIQQTVQQSKLWYSIIRCYEVYVAEQICKYRSTEIDLYMIDNIIIGFLQVPNFLLHPLTCSPDLIHLSLNYPETHYTMGVKEGQIISSRIHTWRKRLSEFFCLFSVLNDKCVQKSATANLEFHIFSVLLYFNSWKMNIRLLNQNSKQTIQYSRIEQMNNNFCSVYF